MSKQLDKPSDSSYSVVSESESDKESIPDVDEDYDLDFKIQRLERLVAETPSSHPDYLGYQKTLWLALSQKYDSSFEIADLEATIQKIQEVVNLAPEEHPDKARHWQNLAIASQERYTRLGELKDLETALESAQKAVDITPDGHPDKAWHLNNLASYLTDRFRRLGDFKDLETSIQLKQVVIDQTSEADPDWGQHLQNLAVSLTDRYRRLGTLEDLEAAIQKFQEVLDLPLDDRASCLRGLSSALKDRYKRSGDLKDLEAVFQKDKEALDLTPQGDPDRAEYLHSLAASYIHRYQRLGDEKDLEEALQKFQTAADLISEGPGRVEFLEGLAVAFSCRYRRFGELKDLEILLQTSQEAVNLAPEGHPARAECLKSLAVSFIERYERLGHLKDLEAALEKYQEGVDLTQNSDRGLDLNFRAVCLTYRYRRLGDLRDLETAMQMLQQVVDFRPAAECIQSLATCLTDQYMRLGDLKDLEAAVQMKQEVLDLTPTNHPKRAQLLQGLAISFRARYQRLGNLNDIETAIQRFEEAVLLTPENHPKRPGYLRSLAVALTDRYQRLGSLKDFEDALEKDLQVIKLTPSNHPERPGHLQSLAMSFADQYRRSGNQMDLDAVRDYFRASFDMVTTTPEVSWRAALDWASFAEEFQLSDCPDAYSAAFRLLPEILWIGYTVPWRHDTLRRLDIGQVTSTAAKTCISMSYLKSAIEIMEQGLATVFQQMLQLKTDVDGLSKHLAEEFQNLSLALYSETFSNPTKLAIRRNQLLDDIRKQKDFEHFLLPKPYKVLSHASQGGPIVILNSHKDCCDGIIIPDPASDPVHVTFPEVTLELLRSQSDMLKTLLEECSVRMRGDSSSTRLFARRELFSSKNPQELFSDMLLWLWRNVVGPVYEVLNLLGIHSGRLWWLPTGAFSGLPLHASPPTDEFIHSYTATLGSLLGAHAKKTSNHVPKLGIVGVTHTGPGGMNALKGVEQEVQKILSIVKNSDIDCLEGPQAKIDAVILQLQDCSWVHLACHGTQNLSNPTKSHLILYGGSLELETILRMPLSNAEFVFLAACQTAMGYRELTNEFFHLGGGFIAAGFRGAIGTMWSMKDEDGPLVAEIVYSHLFRDGQQPQASDAARALQLAVRELRNRKVSYERWMPFIHMGI